MLKNKTMLYFLSVDTFLIIKGYILFYIFYKFFYFSYLLIVLFMIYK